MNLFDLRQSVRRKLRDTSQPTLWSDAEIDSNINEAEREACIRSSLIEDDTSPITLLDVNTTDRQYTIDPLIVDVAGITVSGRPDLVVSGWTLRENVVVFDRVPARAEFLQMRVYRLPLKDMEDDDDEPEIRAMYHDKMIDWAISLCYLVPDSDAFDQGASDRYAARFSASFGERKSALTIRTQREKTSKAVAFGGYF